MTREEKISYLIDSDFKFIEWNPEYLDSILKNGFKGYDNFSNEELESALKVINMSADELYNELTAEQPMAFIGDLVEEDIQKALKGA
jgi:hypothetical protein